VGEQQPAWDYGPPADRSPPEHGEWSREGRIESHHFRGRIERVFPVVATGHVGSSHFTNDDFREWLWPWRYELDQDTGDYVFTVDEYADAEGKPRADAPVHTYRAANNIGEVSDLFEVWEHLECVAREWIEDRFERSVMARRDRNGRLWQFVEGLAKSRRIAPDKLLEFCTVRGIPMCQGFEGEPMVDAVELDEHLGWAIDDAIRAWTFMHQKDERPRRVYFIRAARTGLVKIGVTVDVAARLRGLRTMSADTLTLLASVPGSQALERELHERFKVARRHGEWFEPTPELLAYVAEIQRKERER